MPLNTFTRHPYRVLRELGPGGIILTRAGEPDLHLRLEPDAKAAPSPSATAAGSSATTPSPDSSDQPTDSRTSSHPDDEASGTADAGSLPAIAQAAFLALQRDAFENLLVGAHPWIGSLPPAAQRMALDQIEQARTGENASLAAVDAVLATWREKATPYLH